MTEQTRVPSMPWFVDCPDCGVAMDPPPKPHADGCVVGDLLTHIGRKDIENEQLRDAIRHEYHEARAHRTDNRTALTRLYRLAQGHQRAPASEFTDG